MDRLRDTSPAGHGQRFTCAGKQTPFAPVWQASLHESGSYILKRND
ncbi:MULTISPECIES: hypothetical protein [unclassified Minwuia]|nr:MULTISPECIES: hypothetical protein [unclassified Minwuia]